MGDNAEDSPGEGPYGQLRARTWQGEQCYKMRCGDEVWYTYAPTCMLCPTWVTNNCFLQWQVIAGIMKRIDKKAPAVNNISV